MTSDTAGSRSRTTAVLPLAVALVYAGIAFGVAFVAVPAKFMAASISLPQALDVGRWEFRFYGWVDLVAAVTLAVVTWGTLGARRLTWPVLVLAIVLIQGIFLRSELDERVESILGGGAPPPSSLHTVYGGLEAAKLLILLGYAILLGRPLSRLTRTVDSGGTVAPLHVADDVNDT